MDHQLEDQHKELRKERLYIAILAAIQIVHILDFVIMMPLGPKFMKVFSITPAEFSTLVAAYTFSAGGAGLFGALYADHFDRKKFLLFNFTGFLIGTFLCGIAPGFGALLGARIIAGAFGGVLNSIVLALVSDLIPFQRRGAAMGVVMSSFSMASVAGVPLGIWIANTFDWHWTFFFICIVGIIFWILSIIVLPAIHSLAEPKSFSQKVKNLKLILSQKEYLVSFAFTSILSFSMFIVIPFIAPFMVRNVGMTEGQLPLIYLVGGAGTIMTARMIGKLCDKIGSFTIFRAVAIFSLLPIFLLTNLKPNPLWLCLIVTSLFTMVGSGRFIPAMTILSAVVKPQERGTFMSLENSFRQFSSGLASQVAGLIIVSEGLGQLDNYNVVGHVAMGATLISLGIAFHLRSRFKLK